MSEREYRLTRRGLFLHAVSFVAVTDLAVRKLDSKGQQVTQHLIADQEKFTLENIQKEFGNPRDLIELGYIFLLAPLLNWGPTIIAALQRNLTSKDWE